MVAFQELFLWSPGRARNTSPPDYQSRAVKEHSLCGLHVSANFPRGVGKHRAGACLLSLMGQWKRILLGHTHSAIKLGEHKYGTCHHLHPQRVFQQTPASLADI